MNIGGHDIGVCSWSLHPKDLGDLIAQVKEAGLSHIQLGLIAPLTVLDAAKKAEQYAQIRAAGITLTGGMIGFPGEDYASIERIKQTGGFVPDAEWAARRAAIEQAAQIGRELGVPHLSAHIGFVPHKSADPQRYQAIVDRVRDVADLLKGYGLGLNLETGQEPAAELLEFLQDVKRDGVGINFDPANMILYGAGDPIAAIKTLAPYIKHVHVKDATASAKPGVDWGEEVPFGTGQVGAARFIAALTEAGYRGPLCIEREAGSQRLTDVKFAVETLKKVAG
jgi:L-ribulose-5-phosphate 3-epimerase